MTSEDKARMILTAADGKQARDMALLDLNGLTMMTDYFFICTGTSTTHIRTLADVVLETMKHEGYGGIRIEGYDSAQWVLMDYGDVVIHIMSPEYREYYGLESFWKDAPRLPLNLPEPNGGQ